MCTTVYDELKQTSPLSLSLTHRLTHKHSHESSIIWHGGANIPRRDSSRPLTGDDWSRTGFRERPQHYPKKAHTMLIHSFLVTDHTLSLFSRTRIQ